MFRNIKNFNKDEFFAISRGRVIGHQRFSVLGFSSLINSVESTVWPLGGNAVILGTAQTLDLHSTDANDTSAGTGAQSVVVRGVDGAGDFLAEEVVLDGLSDVSTVGEFQCVNRMTVFTAGSNKTNIGDIICDDGVNNRHVISALDGISHCGWYLIPNGKFLSIVTQENSTNLDFDLFSNIRVELDTQVQLKLPPTIFKRDGKTLSQTLVAPTSLAPPGLLLEIRASVFATTGSYSTTLAVIEVDEAAVNTSAIGAIYGH